MTVTVRFGDLGAATTDITSKVRSPGGNATAWSLTEAAEKGAPALTGFATEDPASALTLKGLKEVHFEDSGSTDPRLFAGFFDIRNVARATTRGLITDVQREWDATVTDLNALLTDRIIQSGKRPAETDIARIDWLLASGYLPIGDTPYIDDATATSLPAADYTGRTPADVLAECSNLSGQNYFVRWEQSCTFPDPASPWYVPSVTTWAAPYSYGSPPTHVPSPYDLLGGRYWDYNLSCGGLTNYEPAASIYPSAVAGSNMGTANNGCTFGTGIQVASGAYDWTTSYTWDLASLGSPPIGTYCVDRFVPGTGYFSMQNLSILLRGSPDGTSWTTLATLSNSPHAAGPDPALADVSWPSYRYIQLVGRMWGDGLLSDYWSMDGVMFWPTTPGVGPGPALGYHAYNWSGDASTLAISNVLSEIDNVTTFGPGQSDKLIRNPARVYSGCWFEYNGGHVYESYAATLSAFRARDVRASDMNCTSAANATALANAYLLRCATEEDRFTANLDKVPAAVVNSMRPGQRIKLKLSHVPGYTTGTYMAIMRRTLTPLGADLYKVQLELANPVLTGFHPDASGIAPSLWSQNIGNVIAPATTPADALPGQRVPYTVVGTGDGFTTLFSLSTAYQSGSVLIQIDGVPIDQSEITETSPTTGLVALHFAPAAASSSAPAETVTASWQVA